MTLTGLPSMVTGLPSRSSRLIVRRLHEPDRDVSDALDLLVGQVL
jgi:hypothetical protein